MTDEETPHEITPHLLTLSEQSGSHDRRAPNPHGGSEPWKRAETAALPQVKQHLAHPRDIRDNADHKRRCTDREKVIPSTLSDFPRCSRAMTAATR